MELMPVQEFNETSVTRKNPQTSQALSNYWGYDPVVFFAPKASYSSSGGLGQQKLEFKEMVRAFHHAGIEVILDVVFNHTAEGNELGPTLCFRGMDNAIFYTLAKRQTLLQGLHGHRQHHQRQPSRRAGPHLGRAPLLDGRDACRWIPV